VTSGFGEGGASPSNDDRYPVLIIGDHELFSTTVGIALRSQGFDARTLPVACVADLQNRPSTRPTGLVVLDLDARQDEEGSRIDGAELVRVLREQGWTILVVNGSADRSGVAAAVAAGAIGALPKSRPFEVLLGTVTSAAAGAPVMSELERAKWLAQHNRHAAEESGRALLLSRLTRREREVLDLLAAGMRAAAVADHFVVSLSTVRSQVRCILTKLEVSSQLEAVALLRSIPPPFRPAIGRTSNSATGTL
jgi:DNA-binding NarL/FixJ family response regulator